MQAQARALAPRLGIRVLDEKGLKTLEKGLESENSSFSADDRAIYEKMSTLWGIQVKSGQQPTQEQLALKSVYQYLQYNYWMLADYINIQTIMDRFAEVQRNFLSLDLKHKYLAFVGLQRLSLSIIKMAGYVAARDLTDVGGQFKIAFFGGTYRMRSSTQIIEYLDRLSGDSKIGEKLELEPPYFDELAEIVNRIIHNSPHATKILRLLDVVMTEDLFGSNRNIEQMLGNMFSIEALVVLKRIASMFHTYTGMTQEIFEELWKL
jgi:hypothetical protein